MELAAYVCRGSVSEQQIELWILADIHPSHDINPDFIRSLIELHAVPPAFMHGPAIFSDQGRESENGICRPLALKNRAHCDERIEPILELTGKAFGDEVSGEPSRSEERRVGKECR